MDTSTHCCKLRFRSSNPAGRSPSPGGVGWRGLPLRTNHGADSGFRRTASLHPRRAKRKVQVCGDSTVKGNGRWAGSPHPPQAVPLPLRGEGLNALQVGHDFPCRARHFHIPHFLAYRLRTLREGERVFSSPHPPRSGPPSPQGATAGAVLTSSTANAVPLPLIGEGLSAR